ncbi:hypothetical protein HCU64_19630 [Methylobacterium sp. C25]|uniref:hypothetical protein n=1 Tax=Methylobacterium sp. C25 TaxID=2721622 RepID=UPI001F1B09E1|nr:hypothetical protein [Methylobacterium sp. C25]MCE4225965.1 hypothetical protein [Methylobacterium sp. C25]
MGRLLGIIGAMELLVAVAVFGWFGDSGLCYPAVALTVLTFGTMLLGAEFIGNTAVLTK